MLLRNGVILIEYLSNTAALTAPRTFLCCLPLKVPAADGAPARVIALVDLLASVPTPVSRRRAGYGRHRH